MDKWTVPLNISADATMKIHLPKTFQEDKNSGCENEILISSKIYSLISICLNISSQVCGQFKSTSHCLKCCSAMNLLLDDRFQD